MSLDAMASRGSSVAGACCYGNMDCEVSKGWLKNYTDFWPKINIVKVVKNLSNFVTLPRKFDNPYCHTCCSSWLKLTSMSSIALLLLVLELVKRVSSYPYIKILYPKDCFGIYKNFRNSAKFAIFEFIVSLWLIPQ